MPGHRDRYTQEQVNVLQKYGYPADLAPRGVGGGAGKVYGGYKNGVEHWMRNRICALDDIEVDGHEQSDLDTSGDCIHCGMDGASIAAQDDRWEREGRNGY